jgi:hypothetical protein
MNKYKNLLRLIKKIICFGVFFCKFFIDTCEFEFTHKLKLSASQKYSC